MARIKCTECGQIFESNLNACPNCGCPASECEIIYEEKSEPVNGQYETTIGNQQSQEQNPTQNEEINSHAERMTKCPDCGQQISVNAKRCPHCGAKGKFAPLDYGNAIYDCFCRKYFCFSGRSRRSEVFPFLIMAGMMCGTLIYFKQDGLVSNGPNPEYLPFFITLFPLLGAIVRRLHDIGRSGWWVICPVIPEIFIFKDSDKGENEYGKSPKYQPECFTEELPDRGTEVGAWIVITIIVLAIVAFIIMKFYLFNDSYY